MPCGLGTSLIPNISAPWSLIGSSLSSFMSSFENWGQAKNSPLQLRREMEMEKQK